VPEPGPQPGPWSNGRKNAIGRLGRTSLENLDAVNRTIDRDFEAELTRYEEAKAAAAKK